MATHAASHSSTSLLKSFSMVFRFSKSGSTFIFFSLYRAPLRIRTLATNSLLAPCHSGRGFVFVVVAHHSALRRIPFSGATGASSRPYLIPSTICIPSTSIGLPAFHHVLRAARASAALPCSRHQRRQNRCV